MIKVIAIKDGTYDGKYQKAGSSFEVANKEKIGRWMKVVEPQKKGKTKAPSAESAE
jgi:hypothetical protein